MQLDENTFCKMIKARAKATLFQHPLRSLLAGLLPFAPMALLGLILRAIGAQTEVSTAALVGQILGVLALYILVMAPLKMGQMRYLGMASRGQEPGASELLYYGESFRAYRQSIKLLLMVEGCTLPWMVLFCTPSLVYAYYLMGLTQASERQLYVLIFLTVTGVMLSAIKRQTYWASMVLAAGNPQIRPLAALQSARLLFHGKWPLLCRFYISFLFWMVLSLLSGGLCTILYDLYYTESYIMLVDALCISMVMQKKQEQEEDNKETSERKDD